MTESRSKSRGPARVDNTNLLVLVGLVSEYAERIRSCKDISRMSIRSIFMLTQHWEFYHRFIVNDMSRQSPGLIVAICSYILLQDGQGPKMTFLVSRKLCFVFLFLRTPHSAYTVKVHG